MFNDYFITSLLNISMKDVAQYECRIENFTAYYDITLKRKQISCPFYDGKMIGRGKVLKRIKHPAVRGKNGEIRYRANQYICKKPLLNKLLLHYQN